MGYPIELSGFPQMLVSKVIMGIPGNYRLLSGGLRPLPPAARSRDLRGSGFLILFHSNTLKVFCFPPLSQVTDVTLRGAICDFPRGLLARLSLNKCCRGQLSNGCGLADQLSNDCGLALCHSRHGAICPPSGRTVQEFLALVCMHNFGETTSRSWSL